MVKKLFKSLLYVKIYKNKIVVKTLTANSPPQMFAPDTPFTTQRLLIGNFAPAQQCLKRAIHTVAPKFIFKARPSLLLQPMEMCEGGLSEVEEKILRECALSAGARKVVLWMGEELSNDKAIEKLTHSK